MLFYSVYMSYRYDMQFYMIYMLATSSGHLIDFYNLCYDWSVENPFMTGHVETVRNL